MEDWTGDDEQTRSEHMKVWIAQAIWWERRLEVLRLAREALVEPDAAGMAEVAETGHKRVRRALRRTAPAMQN